MFRHLLRLTWKRKSRNLMLSLEILLAFAIVFGVAACGLRYAQLYRLPLGFDATDVWSVRILAGDDGRTRFDEALYDSFRRGLAELPEVDASAFVSFEPYAMSTISSDLRRAADAKPGARQLEVDLLEADDALPSVLGLRLAEGRWFSPLDNGSADRPAVINRRMAQAMFPGGQALGQRQLFTPFFTTKPGGQGIGLMFVREVLNRHGFAFSLATTPDGETRFEIRFR